MDGVVSDCNCRYDTVNEAVKDFFVPVLGNLTTRWISACTLFYIPHDEFNRPFFRYFRLNLETPCPFWQEEGQCSLEGCSVCTCPPDEVPSVWLQQEEHAVTSEVPDTAYGWISRDMKEDDSTLSKLDLAASTSEENGNRRDV